MTDEAAFLAAIIAAPDDDTPRLVFADWLHEQGQCARAEFIRVQCELAKYDLPGVLEEIVCAHLSRDSEERRQAVAAIHRRLDALRLRERELWQACCVDWFRGAPFCVALTPADACNKSIHGFPRRGFVASVTCTAEDWLRHGDAITAYQPIEEVRLMTLPLLRSVGLLIGLQGDSALYGDEVNSDRRLDDCLTEKLLRLRWPRVKTWRLLPPAPLVDLPEIIRTTHLNPSIR